PEDFVNFAFNQIYGPESWMNFDQADDFFVHNLDEQQVYIDVDFQMQQLSFLGFDLPFWPTNLLAITIAQPDGTVQIFIRSIYLTPLPVPASPDYPTDPTEPTEASDSPWDDTDSDDVGDDDYDDADPGDWDEPESDDYDGIVEIEDPDENGEFEETEWCEEC
ncbi:MAG: hypothetical protein KJO82_12120, partial [Gammaproteobacteria bacterium]|nr:hypothetical protein [Gammaproteobacteria bacterium]